MGDAGKHLVERLAAKGNPERRIRRPAAAPAPPTTILIVEDENSLRTAVATVLNRRGFVVIEACDGTEAIQILTIHDAQIHIMLLDLTLPGASSRDVFLKAQSVRPDTKVIVTSAHPKSAAESFFKGLAISQFIRKPYSVKDLISLLGSV